MENTNRTAIAIVFRGGGLQAKLKERLRPVSQKTDCMKLACRNPPIGKLLNEFIGDGPFCSSGVVWGMTFSRKDFMVG